MITTLLKLDEHASRARFWHFLIAAALIGVFQGLVLGLFLSTVYALFTANSHMLLISSLSLLIGALVNGALQAWVVMRGFNESMRIIVVMHPSPWRAAYFFAPGLV